MNYRINWQIKSHTVRLVKDGKQYGVILTEAARKMAVEEGLDLVEIVAKSTPPVCSIMDFGKFKYEQKIKEKEAAKRTRETQTQLKEIRLRPLTDDNDVEVKANQTRKFLEDGKKVQINLFFKGYREAAHKDQGFRIVKKIIDKVQDIGSVELPPKLEGNRLICRIQPKV